MIAIRNSDEGRCEFDILLGLIPILEEVIGGAVSPSEVRTGRESPVLCVFRQSNGLF